MPKAEAVSVVLQPDLIRALRESVEVGHYASVDAAMQDAVRTWQRVQQDRVERLAAIKARIEGSIDDPRPSLTEAEVDQHFTSFLADQAKLRGDEAA